MKRFTTLSPVIKQRQHLAPLWRTADEPRSRSTFSAPETAHPCLEPGSIGADKLIIGTDHVLDWDGLILREIAEVSWNRIVDD